MASAQDSERRHSQDARVPTVLPVDVKALPRHAAQSQHQALSVAKDNAVWSQEKHKWNTKNLAQRIGCDFLAAGAAGAIVAPIITIIDR